MASYLKQVLGSLGKGGVLMPRLAQFLDVEAIQTSKEPKLKKRIVQQDSVLSIRCLRRRYSEFAHGQKKRPEFAFHPSAIGMCLRRLWFDHFKAPRDRRHRDDVVQTYLIFEFGTYMHVIFQNLCERAGLLVQREFQLYDPKNHVEGTCDGILKIDKEKYVLEIKTINSGQWVKVQQAPKFEHKQQVMAYMKALGINWSVIVYLNKDRAMVKEFVVEYDEPFYQEHIRNRVLKYKKAIEQKTVPPKEGTKPSTFPCSFCPYTTLCFSELSTQTFARKLKNENPA